VKKEKTSDFKAGDIFKYKGKDKNSDQSGTACVTSQNDKYVEAKGIDGFYNQHAGLGFFLEHYDLFLEEEVWVEDLPEVEVREPGVFRVGDIVEIKHDGESHWLGEIEVTGVKDGKIINAKNISASPWSPGTGLGFMTTAIHYGFKLKEV